MSEAGDPEIKRDLSTSERWLGLEKTKLNSRLLNFGYNLVVYPAVWFRENVVEPNRQESYWFHRRYRRVPTIEECHLHDIPCRMEAKLQMIRDRKVERAMINILRERLSDCMLYHHPAIDPTDSDSPCNELEKTYTLACTNHYIKYGDMPYFVGPEEVLMKQKHRLIWERRHGKLPSALGQDL